MPSDMSFREKSAWITFGCLLATFTPFFYFSYRSLTGGMGHRDAMSTAIALLMGFVVLEVVLHVIMAIRAPRDARTPKDERERLIEMRATRTAFPVLIVGALFAAGTIHLTSSAFAMQQAVLLAIVVAELVKYGMQIVLFRRGA